MRVNFRVKICGYTLFVMVSKTQTLEGVTSLQPNGKHIVMADLENCSLKQVEATLRKVQKHYGLSHIFITSDAPKSWRAWCFSRVDFRTLLRILLDVDYLDWNFFWWTVRRGKATLRTSNKQNRPPQEVVGILQSYYVPFPESCEKVVYDTGIEKRGTSVLLGG